MSLDAQRERIRAYCAMCGIDLLEIISDDLSGKSLERPGLKKALRMLDQGKANAIIVVKLDRLTRSVLDLGVLLQQYFLQERFYLLSVTESLDTRNAMGRFVLYILALIAQWEREAISERTRDAMRHLKAQGVSLGRAPFGCRYAKALDDRGRRVFEPDEQEQKVIAHIVALHEEGMSNEEISLALNSEKIPSPRGKEWHRVVVHRLLIREGKVPARVRAYRARHVVKVRRDKAAAGERARALRAEGHSLREIAGLLIREGLYPPRGDRWYAANVSELVQVRDLKHAGERALALRSEGLSLREVGRRLLYEGYLPVSGGLWSAKSLADLIKGARPLQSSSALAV